LGKFEFSVVGLNGIDDGQIGIGDFDLDSDTDIFIYGYDTPWERVSALYYNNSSVINDHPTPPEDLNTTVSGGVATLSWSKGTDLETPQNSLLYNLRMGLSQGLINVVSPNSHLGNGRRKLSSTGDLLVKPSQMILGLQPGTYYWSIQTVDNSSNGSGFPVESSFNVPELFSEWNIDTIRYDHIEVGDYDNDNDLDILVSGIINDGHLNDYQFPLKTKLYTNDGSGNFIESAVDLVDLFASHSSFGDYDNDNDLDIVICGRKKWDQDTSITVIYQNLGNGEFNMKEFNLIGYSYGKVDWNDLDNDGDLDLLLYGRGHLANIGVGSRLLCYENKGVEGFLLREEFPDMFNGGFLCADLDNDFDLEIIYYGEYNSDKTHIYENLGNWEFHISDTLIGMHIGDIAQSDYDNDGDIDLLVQGRHSIEYQRYLYRNENDQGFVIANDEIPYTGGVQNWFDWDNDGFSDINTAGTMVGVIQNKGNGEFSEIREARHECWYALSRIADLNNDQSLDIIYSEMFEGLNLATNNGNFPNNSPEAPLNLVSKPDGYGITLRWDHSFDTQSKYGGLSYNLRIGTSPGVGDVMSPMSDFISGYRFLPEMGNVGINNGWSISHLDEGTYYWSVQAVDQSFVGGTWAAEDSFTIKPVYVDFTTNSTCQQTPMRFIDRSLIRDQTIDTWFWEYGDGGASGLQNPQYVYTDSGTHNVTLTVSVGGEQFSVTKEVYVKPSPEADFRVDEICLGELASFVNQSKIDGLYIFSWHWDFDDGITSSIENPQPHGYVNPGIYNVSLKVDAENGCSDSINKIVNIIPASANTIISEGIPCANGNFLLKTTDIPSNSYQWSLDGINIPGSNQSYYYPIESGEYSVLINSSCGEVSASYNVEFLFGPPRPELFVRGPEVWILACSNDSADAYRWYQNGEQIPGADGPIHVANQHLGEYYVSISNGGECFTNSNPVTIPISTTISKRDPFANLKIYPNPTLGVFNIEMDNPIMGDLLIDIFNELGGKVINIKFLKETSHFVAQVDLSFQNEGIYLMNLELNNHFEQRKIVIK